MLAFLLACSFQANETKEKALITENETKEKAVAADQLRQQATVLFGTISSLEKPKVDLDKVTLGYLLYSEKALSGNGKQSCETCHLLNYGGAEPLTVSIGAYGKPVERNSPSTFNSVYDIAQFWDGRAATLKEQSAGPILAAGEMGMPSESAAELAVTTDFYLERFRKAFPGEQDPITFDNITEAIAEFEKTLITEDRFDDWMGGEDSLTPEELDGLQVFISVGCAGCHNGPLLGGNSYQKVGIVEPYRHGDDPHVDLGRYNITGLDSDKEVFKVPSLRNVGSTAPYFHDGMISNLADAVTIMGRIQLGKELTQAEIDSIVVFLLATENTRGF